MHNIKTQLENKTNDVYKRAFDQIADQLSHPDRWEDVSNDPAQNPYGALKKLYIKEDASTGRKYELWVDGINNVTTFVLVGSPQDKKNGLVGTDGRAVVKQFEDNAYDYVKVDDFIDRQMLVFKAALKIAGDNELIKQNILAYQNVVLQEIRNKCQFTLDPLKADDASAKDFYDKLAKAKDIMENSLIDLAHICLSGEKRKDKDEVMKFIKDIKANEIDVVREQGRPFIIKAGKIRGKEMVSVQFPLGDNTVPSSDRTGNHTIKLSNHVRDGSGELIGGKIYMDVVVDGHSSYPPITEPDERKRRYIAYQAVEEKVKQLAKDEIAAGNPNKPIEISIATMMMLTPLISKGIEQKARGKESEHGQLADTQYGIKMFLAKKPMTVRINGEDVPVKVDFTLMNLPVNTGKKMQQIARAPLQHAVNIRGFQDYSDQVAEYLKLYKNGYVSRMLDVLNKDKAEIDTIKASMTTVKKELEIAYNNLTSYLKDYNSSPGKYKSTSEYDACRKKIRELEDKLNQSYEKINAIQTKNYIDNKLEYNNLITEIRKELSAVKESGYDLNPDKELILLLRYLESQKNFREEIYLNQDSAYQFHVNFVLVNEMMDKDVEAFCKSAEDRTGWLRVSLLANIAFEKEYKRPPDFSKNEDKEIYFKICAAQALELSASIENTKYNSEARSLQVSQAFTNPHYNMKAGNILSKLAKDIFPQLNRSLDSAKALFFGIPNSMMKKIEEGKWQQPSLLFQRSRPPMTVTAEIIPPPEPQAIDSTTISPEPQVGQWESKRLFRGNRSVEWEVTKNADKTTLVVTNDNNIKDGLLKPSLISQCFSTDSERQKKLELAANLVDAVIAPLRESGATHFKVEATLSKEYENMAPYIDAYCKRKGYECFLFNVNGDRLEHSSVVLTDKKFEKVDKSLLESKKASATTTNNSLFSKNPRLIEHLSDSSNRHHPK